jgi:ATP-dependent DNA helicase RecG
LDECKKAGLPEPIFRYDSPCFVIEFTGKPFNELKENQENEFDKTSDKIIQLIKDNSKTTINELVKIIGISQRAIEMQLSKLQKKKSLKRVDGRKHGYWEIE